MPETTRPRGRPKTGNEVSCHVRFPQGLHAEMVEIASAYGQSVAEYVRRAVAAQVDAEHQSEQAANLPQNIR